MVLSASQADDDVESAYRLGANAYMVKPSTLQELQVMVRTAHEFWKSCAKPKRVSLVQPDRN
jgi:DNA-binding NarL/FixJ family response regulator